MNNQEVGLEAAILQRKRNSSLVDVCLRRKFNGAKLNTEDAGSAVRQSGRGAFCAAVKFNREVGWSAQK
ncbi:TPA: hypothetical protein DCX20_01415 [Patescibacteria group bacterium]|nr:hypothetical protein [Patescibacteria group bacterium]